jgi:glutathione synthase/RimK-type ligase-like ATP-grasp enzyme
MKNVMVLFGKSNWKKSSPFANKDYQYSYEYFYSLCQKNGVQMYRASYGWYDYKNHFFKYAWIYVGKSGGWKRIKNIKPDLIYDKTKARMETYYKKSLMAKHYSFINDLRFTQIIDDKFLTSKLFSEWSKESFIVKNNTELQKTLKYIKTTRVVIKPISESGGKGILIISKSAARKLTLNDEYIVQEFIDSSHGISGITDGTHDLRLVFVNEKVVYAYIREPKKGNLLANLAQGGRLRIVPNKLIPPSVSPIIKRAEDLFGSFNPRVYTIDIMYDKNQKPWIVELNSMPGLYFTPEERPSMAKMYRTLLRIFKNKLDVL